MARSRTTLSRRTTLTADEKISLRHGAYSPGLLAADLPAEVAELRDAIADTVPYMLPIDSILVEQAARQIVRIRRVDQYLDRLGGSLIDAKGRPRGCWQLYIGLQNQLRATLTMLGVGPKARAELLGGLAGAQKKVNIANAQERLRREHEDEQ